MNPIRRNVVCLFFSLAGLLGLTPSAQAATYGQQVVAAVLMAEARGEGLEAMYGVAEVIRNRADGYGISPLAVVKMKYQFTCLNKTTPERLIRRFLNHPMWSDALAIARTTYNKPQQLPGVARGATHYHSLRYNPWHAIDRPVAVIGKLKFYRMELPGA